MSNVIRISTRQDLGELRDFLERANLSTDGLENYCDYYVLIEDENGKLSATLGLEPINKIGVLRSLVVNSTIKEAELLTIFQHVYKLAKEKELSTVYLSTNKSSSIPLFQWMGFQIVEKEQLPDEFELSTNGKQLLSMVAVFFMKKEL